MKKLLFALLLLPTLCFAQAQYVSAVPLNNHGSTCKVSVSDYRPGSTVFYLGDCGWTGLKGTAAYITAWNHSNHVQIVRGNFSSGKAESFSKVTYINFVDRTVATYEESQSIKINTKSYDLDGILADAKQSGVRMNGGNMAYITFANYIDVFE
jgi:hypothetical protein